MPSHYTPTKAELAPGLYLVATPIGNLGDITFRALSTLTSVDVVACEDTRISKRLLNHYGISAKLEAYHEHNAVKMRPKLLELLSKSGRVALISDAGTPLISDPGYKLVAEAIEAGIAIYPIPGASSVMAALCTAGLPTDKFAFLGFLPNNKSDALQWLQAYKHTPGSLVLFSTPSKLADHLQLCHEVLGDRKASLCREITKIYEESIRGNLTALIDNIDNKDVTLKGEMVLVIGPAEMAETVDQATIDTALREHMARLPLKSAVQEVAALYDLPKNKLYERALQLKEE